MKLFCPTCGYANEAGLGTSLTCKSCGASFNTPTAPPPPPAPAQVAERVTPTIAAPPPAPLAYPSTGAAPNHPAAIASLVLGILCCVPFAGIGSIISGAIALKAIQQAPGSYRGKELAIAGMLLGGSSIAFMVLSIIVSALKQH